MPVRRYGPSRLLHHTNIDELLSKPTWSVKSLLPSATEDATTEVTSAKLHHLLRLSALPLPGSPAEEAEMLQTLHSQLHFLKDIQDVDTTGVEPLRSIRDETKEGAEEETIGLDTPDIMEALAKEEVKGRGKRPRRKRVPVEQERWDVLGTAGSTEQMAGAKYFVVRSGKD